MYPRDTQVPSGHTATARVVAVLSALAVGFGSIALAGSQSPIGSGDVTLSLPRGSAETGREALIAFRCHACHRIPGDSRGDLPSPVSASPGPDLGQTQTLRGSGYVATSIISPSHEISLDPNDELVHEVNGLVSPMSDYSHLMTVRQLVDLIAYLESLTE